MDEKTVILLVMACSKQEELLVLLELFTRVDGDSNVSRRVSKVITDKIKELA